VKAALRGGYGVMRRYQVVVKTLVESRWKVACGIVGP
jgi:hypothetical protein